MKLNGRRVWGVLCVGGRQVRGLLVGACAALCGQGVEASSFRVGEASGAQRWVSEQERGPLAPGQGAAAPWRAVTAEGGHLLLFGGGMRLEFTGRCDTELAAMSRPLDPQQVHTFLKPGTTGGTVRASDSVFNLREGTLLAEIGERPLSLSCPHLQVDARSAVFALTSAPLQGALLTVLQGQVKVRTQERTVIFVGAGKSLRIASGLPPRLGLLDESPEGLEHKRGLLRLSSAKTPGAASLPTEAREAVGTGGEAPFDLSRRRRAALLTAPSPDQIGLPEVSPELQQTPTLKP
jgi:hypothetical protein